MSYHPSHRRPPRQERWPNATPPEGWPSYRDGEQADGRNGADRLGTYPVAAGYHGRDGYPDGANGYGWYTDGKGWGADGYAEAAGDFAAQAGYRARDRYAGPAYSDPLLVAPDAGIRPDIWQAGQDSRTEAARRGLAVSGVTGLLAVAVAVGVSTLATGILRSQVAPVTAVTGVLIDRTPAALRNLVAQHFGAHGRDVLLLGMYGVIALLAITAGVLARRAAAPGVAGLAAFSLLAAFVTVTRPGGRVTDVIPTAIGGLAGVLALAWLVRASAPAEPLRYARGGTRRRA